MSEILPYIIGGALLYALLNILFGIWIGKSLAKTNPPQESTSDLLEWPPYRDQRP